MKVLFYSRAFKKDKIKPITYQKTPGIHVSSLI